MCFTIYMGMAAILLNGVESFEQTVNTPSKEGPLYSLEKFSQPVLEKIARLYTCM